MGVVSLRRNALWRVALPFISALIDQRWKRCRPATRPKSARSGPALSDGFQVIETRAAQLARTVSSRDAPMCPAARSCGTKRVAP